MCPSNQEGRIFLVTGGLGAVGSALCLELARRGALEVRSLDVRPDYPSPLHSSLRQAGVLLIHGDVRKKKDVDKALRGVDCVFHLASYVGSGKHILRAGGVDETNIRHVQHARLLPRVGYQTACLLELLQCGFWWQRDFERK